MFEACIQSRTSMLYVMIFEQVSTIYRFEVPRFGTGKKRDTFWRVLFLFQLTFLRGEKWSGLHWGDSRDGVSCADGPRSLLTIL